MTTSMSLVKASSNFVVQSHKFCYDLLSPGWLWFPCMFCKPLCWKLLYNHCCPAMWLTSSVGTSVHFDVWWRPPHSSHMNTSLGFFEMDPWSCCGICWIALAIASICTYIFCWRAKGLSWTLSSYIPFGGFDWFLSTILSLAAKSSIMVFTWVVVLLR